MNDHAEKAHATWSASATTRNWACPGALVLAQQVAHLDKESEPAAWGTACHSVAEWCLREGRDAIEMIGRIIKTKEHELEVDEEMAETAQSYVDYCRSRLGYVPNSVPGKAIELPKGMSVKSAPLLLVEQKFSLEKLKPPFDAGGTADAVIYFPAEQLLEVVDLKGGRGVKVDPNENKQLRTYALGAVLANPGLKIKRVRSTIVQPRIGDSQPKSEEYHIADLMEWTADLVDAMRRSAEAAMTYQKVTGDLTREEWADKHLVAGDHCSNTFCPARGFCPKLEKKATEAVGLWFDDVGEAKIRNSLDDASPEKLEQLLDARDMVVGFFNAAAALAQSMAESGVKFPNYVLVDKIGRRRWKLEDDALKTELKDLFLTNEQIFAEPKLRSPAQLEKVLGAKGKKLVADLIETPVTGRSFVHSGKTTRKAVTPAVEQHFDIIE